jgi:hypothetical protein
MTRAATIYKLMDENLRAWHAGESQWQGRTWLNSSSIGIEIVNPGFKDTPTGRLWYPVQRSAGPVADRPAQGHQQALRHQPSHIIGHSDIAPLRKLDPGPLFPGNAWRRRYWLVAQRTGRGAPASAVRCAAAKPSAGFRHNWHASVMRRRKPVNWMSPPAMCSQRSRCISARPASMARRMRKPQRCFRC